MPTTSRDFEKLLQDAGGFHKYQKQLLFIFLLPVFIILPAFSLNLELFWPVDFTTDYYCNVPGREHFNLTKQEWKDLTAEEYYSEFSSNTHSCTMRNLSLLLDDTNTTNEDLRKLLKDIKSGAQTDEVLSFKDCPKEYGWVSTEYEDTMMLTFNWFCFNHYPFEWLSAFGYAISTLVIAPLADRFGRRLMFFISCFIQMMFGLLMICASNETTLLVFYTLKSISMPAAFVTAYVLVLESIDKHHRMLAALVAVIGYHIGMICFPPEAWLWWANWRICLAITPILAVLPLFYWRFLKESARWLNTRGKEKEAAKVIREMKRINKEATSKDEKLSNTDVSTCEDEPQNKQLCRTRGFMFRLLIVILWSTSSPLLLVTRQYFVIPFTEYGYDSAFIYLAMAVPLSVIYILVHKFGRRWPSSALMLLIALIHVGCIVSYGTVDGNWICSLILNALVPAAVFTHLLFVSELLTTSFRVTALSLLHFLGFIVTISIYNTNASQHGIIWYPISCFVSSILILLLPETIDRPLPDEALDVASLPEKQTFFSLNRVQSSSTDDAENTTHENEE